MIPITKPTMPNSGNVLENMKKCLDSGMITNHEFVKKFEKEVAQFLKLEETAAISSCSAGLILAQRVLKLKGEVITPSFTFHASTHSLSFNNLKPVFADIEEEHFNIDPEKVNEAITPKTSAILTPHIFGHPANVKALQEIAEDNNLKIIYDAAHAFGSKIDNKPIGSFGDIEVFSLSPTKLLTAAEGGIIASKDQELLKKLKIARNYGDSGDYDCEFQSFNSRMSELHAILGLESLKDVERNIEQRNNLADIYKKNLSKIGVKFQKINQNVRTTFKDFSIFIDPEKLGINRDILCEELKKENIITKKYFYPAVHKQKAYKEYNELKLPITEKIASNVLSLPLYSHMTEEEVTTTCEAISKIIENGK